MHGFCCWNTHKRLLNATSHINVVSLDASRSAAVNEKLKAVNEENTPLVYYSPPGMSSLVQGPVRGTRLPQAQDLRNHLMGKQMR